MTGCPRPRDVKAQAQSRPCLLAGQSSPKGQVAAARAARRPCPGRTSLGTVEPLASRQTARISVRGKVGEDPGAPCPRHRASTARLNSPLAGGHVPGQWASAGTASWDQRGALPPPVTAGTPQGRSAPSSARTGHGGPETSPWRRVHPAARAIPTGTGPHTGGLSLSAGLQPAPARRPPLAGGHQRGISGSGPVVPSIRCGDPGLPSLPPRPLRPRDGTAMSHHSTDPGKCQKPLQRDLRHTHSM